MGDPVATCADLVITKAIEGYPSDRLLDMIPPCDRADVARLVGLELACQTLEAAGLRPAPECCTERVLFEKEQGSALRRLARLLIALHGAMTADRAAELRGAARLVGLRRPPPPPAP